MAKYIPKPIRDAIDAGRNFIKQNEIGYSIKPMRAKILLHDRLLRGYEKADTNGPGNSYIYEDPFLTYPGPKEHRSLIDDRRMGSEIDNSGHIYEPVRAERFDKNKITDDNKISIIVYDYNNDTMDNTNKSSGNKPNLSNRRYKSLTLPFVPRELEFRPESNFVGISSFGRNNPFYQFTGAEDTLTFEIDWLSTDESREDVITYCRWIEALSKGDGYNDSPPVVLLSWGQDNKLFENFKWIVVSAQYRLKNFSRGFMKNGEFINNHLLPTQAYQQVTMKRVTDDNLTASQIIGNLYQK